MIIDKNLTFSELQTLAAGVSTNTLDAGPAENAYEQNFLVVKLDTPLTAAQGLSVTIETCDTAAGTYEKLATFEAAKGKNKAIAQRVPFGTKQYTRLNYAVTGAPAGKVSAFIAADIDI